MRRTPRRAQAERCPARGFLLRVPSPRGARRVAALLVATVGVVGLGAASAAQLDAVSASLAAGDAAVSSCQGTAPLSADLVSAWSSGAFRTTAVRVTGVAAACVGQDYRLSVIGTSGQQLVERTGVVPAGGSFTTTSFAAVTTSTIGNVQVVIHS